MSNHSFASENTLKLTTILENLPVSTTQKTPQQTPIANAEGNVYIINVEPGPNGDTDDTTLHTVIRKGVENQDKQWTWSEHLIEDRTIADEWHTVPSVEVDKNGFIHAAYNMHNLPWQYKVSTKPNDISNFDFLGEKLSDKRILKFKENNRTNFPGIGDAAIPGNQITYPAFFKDQADDLYLTYRYAAKPARRFADRAMSSAIAKYDTKTKLWSGIGVQPTLEDDDFNNGWIGWFKKPEIPKAFAMQAGWTSYHPRLSFGPNNEMNIFWMWRKGLAGTKVSKLCFLTSTDLVDFKDSKDQSVNLPATADDCSNIDGVFETDLFYSIGNSATNSKGEPYFVVSPETGTRQLVSFRNNAWQWEDSPYGATEIFFDADDNLWALATGLTILLRMKDSTDWELMYVAEGKEECRPRASLNEDQSIAYVYTPNCKNDTVSVKMFSLQ